MIWQIPRKGVFLENVGEPGLVGEEERQVRGKDAVLDVAQDLAVLLGVQAGEDIVVFLIGTVNPFLELLQVCNPQTRFTIILIFESEFFDSFALQFSEL